MVEKDRKCPNTTSRLIQASSQGQSAKCPQVSAKIIFKKKIKKFLKSFKFFSNLSWIVENNILRFIQIFKFTFIKTCKCYNRISAMRIWNC